MVRCPKCDQDVVLLVVQRVVGIMQAYAESSSYTEIDHQVAEADDLAECFECEYRAPFSKFKEPRDE